MQKELVLNHLQLHGKITDLEAYKLYAIRRLGARIWDLRADGYNIVTKNTKEKNALLFILMKKLKTFI